MFVALFCVAKFAAGRRILPFFRLFPFVGMGVLACMFPPLPLPTAGPRRRRRFSPETTTLVRSIINLLIYVRRHPNHNPSCSFLESTSATTTTYDKLSSTPMDSSSSPPAPVIIKIITPSSINDRRCRHQQ